jgi:hypothetical protein
MPYKDPAKQRDFQKKWIAGRRDNAKPDRCQRCGKLTKDLRFDHTNPSEKTSHRIWSWAPKRRDAELRKGRWLCAACHKLKHTKRALGGDGQGGG